MSQTFLTSLTMNSLHNHYFANFFDDPIPFRAPLVGCVHRIRDCVFQGEYLNSLFVSIERAPDLISQVSLINSVLATLLILS